MENPTDRDARLLAFLAHLLLNDCNEQQISRTRYRDRVLQLTHLSLCLDIQSRVHREAITTRHTKCKSS